MSEEKKKYVPPHLRRQPAATRGDGIPPVTDTVEQVRPELSEAFAPSSSVERGDPGRGRRPPRPGFRDSRPRFGAESGGQTSWATRDGRRIREVESEVFEHVHETSAGINFDSYDNIPVEVTGRGAGAIVPLETFANLKEIAELLYRNVERLGYQRPTPIQKHAFAIIYAGRDLMACAQTGSGKTGAFLLPVLARMLQEGPPCAIDSRPAATGLARSRPAPSPVCLILAPTRELAVQIFNEARKFQFGTGVRSVALYGGSEVRSQCIDLERGCDICVATPGRLNDMLDRRRLKVTLVKYLILDEADRMLDMGFAPQIRSVIERPEMPTSVEGGRQTVMFSATFPTEIQQLARDFLRDYLYLAVGRVGSTNDFIVQRLVYADEDQKERHLMMQLKENDRGLTMIFVETKRKADMIEDMLIDAGFCAGSIHGDRTQQEREEALRAFKSGERPIIVATDVAARGLDITNVTHVINYDLPSNIDDYVHRIGRTGRAGNVGIATSFVNMGDRPILRDLLSTLEECNQDVPSWFHTVVMQSTSGGRTSGRSMGRGRFSRGGTSRDMPSRSIDAPIRNAAAMNGGMSSRFDPLPGEQRSQKPPTRKVTRDAPPSCGFHDAW